MALIKMKPTSPGTRQVVKVDRSHLHKGDPYGPLTTSQSKTGARNHFGRSGSEEMPTSTILSVTLHLAAVFQRTRHCHLVRKFQIAAHRNSHRNPRDARAKRF